MESKSRIGSTLIICGAVCIVAALGLAALYANFLSHAPPPPLRSAIGESEPFFVALTFLCVLTGIAFAVIGVKVGIGQSGQTSKTPSPPP